MQTRSRSGKIVHKQGMYYEKRINSSSKTTNKMEISINQKCPKGSYIESQEKYLVLASGIKTIFGLYPALISGIVLSKGELIVVKVRGFDIQRIIISNLNDKFVISNIKTNEGIKRNRLINTKNLYKEDYFHAVDGNEEELIEIGFFTRYELEKCKKRDAYGILKYNEGDIVYQIPMVFCNHINSNNCTCNQKRRCIKGTIGRRIPSQYWPAITPTYEFLPESQDDAEWAGYIFECQICNDGIWKPIVLNDIIIDQIRKCIASGSEQYISSPYLDIADIPRDLIKTSVFFGKEDLVEYFQEILDDASYTIPKCQAYSYLAAAIKKIFKQKVNLNATSLQTARISAIESSLLSFGVYCDELIAEKSLSYLIEDDINIDFLFKLIKFALSIEFIEEKLNISNVILKRIDDSEIRLDGNSSIKFGYDRKTSSFYVESFAYYPVNADVVRIEQQQQNQMNVD